MNCFSILYDHRLVELSFRTARIYTVYCKTVCMFLYLYIVLFALSSYSPCIAYTTCGINRCVANIIIIILNLLHKLVNVIITISALLSLINNNIYEMYSDVGWIFPRAMLPTKCSSE
jgi:hypothetical protein